jgi:hypothetical protein
MHSEMVAYSLEVARQARNRPTKLPRLIVLSRALATPAVAHVMIALDGAAVIRADETEFKNAFAKVLAELNPG